MASRPFRFLQWSRDLSREDNATAIYNRGTRFSSRGDHRQALACYEKALARESNHADSHYGRGAALAALGRHEEAVCAFQDALSLKPDLLNASYGCAISLAAMNRHAEAIACYDRVLARQPAHVGALYGRGLCSLVSEDLPRGFADLFAGMNYPERLARWERWVLRLSPQWQGGAPLTGKTILVYWMGA